MTTEAKKKPIKVFKTHTFKVHNPSNKKAANIKKSMTQGRYAFFLAIKIVTEDAKRLIGKDKKEKKAGIAAIKKKVSDLMVSLPFGSAVKSGVIEDVTAQVSSFIELTEIGQNAAMPSPTDADIDYEIALNALINSQSKEEEDEARDEMARSLKSKDRPISYVRHRTGGGFMILADKKGRLFAFADLWKAKDKRAKKINIDMIDTRTGEPFKISTSIGMLLPLECSDWHKTALKNGKAKSAKLYLRDNEFYLAVAFEYEVEKREPTLTMGIDRGIVEVATYAIRDENGKLIKSGSFSGLALRSHQQRQEEAQKQKQRMGRRFISGWSNYSENLMHHVSKEIVSVADAYNARVVIEDLSNIKNGPNKKRAKYSRKNNFNRLLSRQQYGKLEKMLIYKLAMVGLPGPFLVHAAYTSITCPVCGHSDGSNRPEQAKFICTQCNFKVNADINGAINIAGKRIWLDQVGKKLTKGKPIPKEIIFNTWLAKHLSL